MENELTVRQETTPAMLLNLAIEKGADLDRLERLMMLQEKWDAGQAKKAYSVAMSAFKSEKITVSKDKVNSQYKSKYSSEDSLLNTVNPLLSKHGLSASFSFTQAAVGIEVTCSITHAAGHSESVSLTGPLDVSGQKNPLQQIKSTVTYLRKATFEAITGIASSDDSGDDDGAGASTLISDAQVSTITDLINEKEADRAKFLRFMACDSVETIRAADFTKAVAALKAKKKVT